MDGLLRDSKSLQSPIESPADREYFLAEAKGREYKNLKRGRVSDYGIFARITENNNHYLILAGIHQFGTWITGDFLRKVLHQDIGDDEQMKVFEGSEDFLAIIKGDLNCDTLTVNHSMVDQKCLWVRYKNEWKLYNKRPTNAFS